MENFQLGEFSLNFEFDFQNDFTVGENHVIENILTDPVEAVGLFETGTPFDEGQANSPSIFDYLCNGSDSTIDLTSLENLPKSELLPFNRGQVSQEIDNYAIQSDSIAEQNVNFDWTTFLDESADQVNVNTIEGITSSVTGEAAIHNDVGDSNNVIRDNGFVYQELKTLDVPQMYANLKETFNLMDLKGVDERMDYSSLVNDVQSDQNDQNVINSTSTSMKQKLFFVPMQLNQTGTESLRRVSTELKNRPLALNTMLAKCANTGNNTKILLPSRPKQVKQKSERYLTVNEQLELIHTKEIVLPSIERKQQKRKRKEAPKIDKEKVPVAQAFEVVLTNIMEPRASGNSKINGQTNTKKTTKAKKVTPKITASKRRADNDEFLIELKSTLRSSKKIKSA